MRARLVFPVALLLASTVAVVADYPVLGSLSAQDPLFIQIQQDIARFYRSSHGSEESAPPLSVFIYHPGPDDDLLSIAARFPLPQDTLASVNRLDSPAQFAALSALLVPSLPGLFVPDIPLNTLEDLARTAREQRLSRALPVVLTIRDQTVSGRFFLGEGFTPAERAYFTRTYFSPPLRGAYMSSGFGFRVGPFTGRMEYHRGIDLVAPEGTEVLAAREGTVRDAAFDSRYGTYVVIRHDNGFETLYAHLAWLRVRLHQAVKRGTIIGGVGSTGLSTGTHLHFEIRRHGMPVDPIPLLPAGWNTP